MFKSSLLRDMAEKKTERSNCWLTVDRPHGALPDRTPSVPNRSHSGGTRSVLIRRFQVQRVDSHIEVQDRVYNLSSRALNSGLKFISVLSCSGIRASPLKAYASPQPKVRGFHCRVHSPQWQGNSEPVRQALLFPRAFKSHRFFLETNHDFAQRCRHVHVGAIPPGWLGT